MVGAGIIGLTSAVRLAEAGYEVGVVARGLARAPTAGGAGGRSRQVVTFDDAGQV